MLFQGFLGIFFFICFCWFCSENRKKVHLKLIIIGIITQVFLALVMTEISIINVLLIKFGKLIAMLRESTLQATGFVFGYVGGGEVPFVLKEGGNTFSLAFQALPMIFVISSLSMVLFHWNILPFIVKVFSWVLQRTLNIGGALGVCAAAMVFLGPTGAPLLIRPYLNTLSRSELFTIMTLGMAATSITMMGIYATLLNLVIPNALSHLLTASIISIPAGIMFSRILIPEEGGYTPGQYVKHYKFSNTIDAIFSGASEGIKIFINALAIIIVFVALVTFLNKFLACLLPNIAGRPLTIQTILGIVLAPLSWLMGIPWSEAKIAGSLLGTKTVLNEVYAFIEFAKIAPLNLNSQTRTIMVYSLCGFANFSSIGIQIGVLGTLMPERRQEVISLVFKALFAGTLSTIMSGTILGLLANFH